MGYSGSLSISVACWRRGCGWRRSIDGARRDRARAPCRPGRMGCARGAAVPTRVAVAHASVSLESKTPGDAAELVAGEPVSASVCDRLAEGEPMEPLRAERLGMRGDGADVAATDLDVVPGNGWKKHRSRCAAQTSSRRAARRQSRHARRADDVRDPSEKTRHERGGPAGTPDELTTLSRG